MNPKRSILVPSNNQIRLDMQPDGFPVVGLNNVPYRVINATDAANGYIRMQLHNADGGFDAVLWSRDKTQRDFYNWQPVLADIEPCEYEGAPCLRIRHIETAGYMYNVSMFEMLPRALSCLDHPFEVLRRAVRAVIHPELRSIIDHVFADPCVFTHFLTRPAFKDGFSYPSGLLDRTASAVMLAKDMKVSSEEERQFLMTAALLYDIGAVKDGNLRSESLRDDCGFFPHPKSVNVASYALSISENATSKRMREVLQTGHCNDYPSLEYRLGRGAALATIDAAIRQRKK